MNSLKSTDCILVWSSMCDKVFRNAMFEAMFEARLAGFKTPLSLPRFPTGWYFVSQA